MNIQQVTLLIAASNFLVAIVCLAVSPNRYNALEREEFLNLDRQVTEFYQTSYEQLDGRNVTYDDHLFESLRAYRHTLVTNQFDYRYTSLHSTKQAEGSIADEIMCQRQLDALAAMAKEAGHLPISAINFFESNGRTEAGVLNGNSLWWGSPSSCVRAKILAQSSHRYWASGEQASDISGRYCVAHLKSKLWPAWDIYFEDRISIKVGVCLPDTCHSMAHHHNGAIRRYVDHLARFNLATPFNGDRYYIDNLYCFPDEDSPSRRWDMGTKLFIVFAIFWFALLTRINIKCCRRELRHANHVSSDHSGVKGNTSGNQYSCSSTNMNQVERRRNRMKIPACDANNGIDFVRAFSIESNLQYLFGARITNEPVETKRTGQEANAMAAAARSQRVNLDILDGIKALATTYIIFGHTMMFFYGFVTDIRFGDERMLDFTMVAVVNSLHVVGLFYIITGILLTYFAFTRYKPKQLLQPSFWLLTVVNRYIRLFPAYFLVFWFAKHVAPHTGSGAYWMDYRTDAESARGICANETWGTMLTMSAADVKIPLDCIPQAWYLSNDFRTLLVMPIYIVTLVLNRTAGYAAILATFTLSFLKLVKILREANIDYMVVLHWQPHVYALLADRLHDVYTDLTVRLSTYLLGVIVGHLLYLYDTRQIKRWPAWLRSFGLSLAITLGAILFMGISLMANPYINQLLPSRADIDSDKAVVVIPFLKAGMEICLSIVLLLMATGSGFGWLNELLSCRIAKVLSNISYAVFLIHVEVMYKFPGLKVESSYWWLFLLANFFIVLSNIVGFFIYLLYEMPIHNLTRFMMRKMLNKMVVK